MAESPTVYVTNRAQSHDYSSATKHGALRFVTQGNYPIFKTTRLQEEIIEGLAHSQPYDLLLFSGSSVVSAICMAVWLEMHSTAKILLWDRTENQYVLRVIPRQSIRVEIERVAEQIQRSTGRMVRGGTARP